jgi:hypothetical protein
MASNEAVISDARRATVLANVKDYWRFCVDDGAWFEYDGEKLSLEDALEEEHITPMQLAAVRALNARFKEIIQETVATIVCEEADPAQKSRTEPLNKWPGMQLAGKLANANK